MAGAECWPIPTRPTYHYVPDVAAGLAMLGTAGNDVYGKPRMLPCAPAESMRALMALWLVQSRGESPQGCEHLAEAGGQTVQLVARKGGRILQHAQVLLAVDQEFLSGGSHAGLRATQHRQLFHRASRKATGA